MAANTGRTLFILAGPNGSGKSSLAKKLIQRYGESLGEWINADEIAASYRTTPAFFVSDIELLAAQEADRRRHAALEGGKSFITETVMSDSRRWVPFFQKARQCGYRIAMYFVTTSDPEINVGRVAIRSRMGGHSVPVDKIRSRYNRVMTDVVPIVIPLTDKTYIFDSSSSGGAQLIATYHRNAFGVPVFAVANVVGSNLESWVKALARRFSPTQT